MSKKRDWQQDMEWAETIGRRNADIHFRPETVDFAVEQALPYWLNRCKDLEADNARLRELLGNVSQAVRTASELVTEAVDEALRGDSHAD